MTKAQLDAAQAALTTTGLVTKARVNTYTGGLGDEVYPETTSVTQDTNSTTHKITVRSGLANIAYLITLWKQGRTVFIDGVVTATGTPSAAILADITDTEFLPLLNTYIPISGIGAAINIDPATNTIRTSGPLTAGSHTFNGTYACLN